MPDWLIAWLGQVQGGIVRTLASELRAGGIGTAGLAFTLGAMHALMPGHGKAALAAYFLGQEAHISKGLRVALLAALLHVLSGLAAFLILHLIVGQLPSLSGRGSPAFTASGYGLIIIAGIMMVVRSVQPSRGRGDGARTLTAGIGLLPCPLTISVLGFAWAQSSAMMVGFVLVSLALGISLTIGLVAILAIIGRRGMGAALAAHLLGLDRWARIVQGVAGALIVTIGLATLASLTF